MISVIATRSVNLATYCSINVSQSRSYQNSLIIRYDNSVRFLTSNFEMRNIKISFRLLWSRTSRRVPHVIILSLTSNGSDVSFLPLPKNVLKITILFPFFFLLRQTSPFPLFRVWIKWALKLSTASPGLAYIVYFFGVVFLYLFIQMKCIRDTHILNRFNFLQGYLIWILYIILFRFVLFSSITYFQFKVQHGHKLDHHLFVSFYVYFEWINYVVFNIQ